MLRYGIILFFMILNGCGFSDADFLAVRKENERLKKEIRDLKKQNAKYKTVSDTTRVILANSELQELKSKFNGQTYKIKIKFPKDYAIEKDYYPVLYVIDAETNFGGVSYIVQRLIKDRLIPKILIVGMAYGTDYRNFYRLRSRDLTPTEVKEIRMGGGILSDPTGGADHFCDFIEKELFPFIEANYRIKKGNRAVYGHSYGGLFGCYVLMNRPQLFNRYLLLSPSLWYNDSLLIKEIDKINLRWDPSYVYMASGRLEARIDDLQTEYIKRLIRKQNPNLKIKSEVLENETHRTIFGAGFTNGLRFIYNY